MSITAALRDVPEAEYFADRQHLSHSAIETFLEDPRDFRDIYVHGLPERAPIPEMRLGKYVHALIGEPETVRERFVSELAPPTKLEWWQDTDRNPGAGDKKTKPKADQEDVPCNRQIRSWASFVDRTNAEHLRSGRTIVTPEMHTLSQEMVLALTAHPEAYDLLRAAGESEKSMYWIDPVTGQLMRGRPDKLIHEQKLIVELKTDQDLDPDDSRNQRRWHTRGHHRKAAVYLDGMHAITGEWWRLVFVYVENKPRPRVAVRMVVPDRDLMVEIGRQEYRAAIVDIRERVQTGEWRQPWEIGVQHFPFPEWAERNYMEEQGSNVDRTGIERV
jgi:hypothetical protein